MRCVGLALSFCCLLATSLAQAQVKHVTDADGHGWLIVKWAEGKTVPAVPQYLRVQPLKTQGGREYFKVLEGLCAGKEAGVKQKAGGGSYLADGDPKEPAARLKFNRKTKQLWYGDSGPIAAMTDPANKVPLGTHDLEIPDEVHRLGEPYLKDSRYATTWFRVGHSGDRFLHPGHVSAGCVTVTDTKKWTDVYDYLIKRRLGDDKSVGRIEVVE
jgi:hypothetical protein